MKRLADLGDCDYGAEILGAVHELGFDVRSDSDLVGSAIGAIFTARNYPDLGFQADGERAAQISALAALLVAKADWNIIEAQLDAERDGV